MVNISRASCVRPPYSGGIAIPAMFVCQESSRPDNFQDYRRHEGHLEIERENPAETQSHQAVKMRPYIRRDQFQQSARGDGYKRSGNTIVDAIDRDEMVFDDQGERAQHQ